MSEENNKDYEFVTETIKKKPLNKKRLAVNTIKSIGMGIIAGLTACVIFAIFAPIIYEKINPEKFDLVSIPEDESSVNTSEVEPDEETNLTQEEKVNSEIVKDDGGVEGEIPETNEIEEEISEPDKNNTEVKEQTETDENEESTETTGDDNTKTLIIQKEEIIKSYTVIYRMLQMLRKDHLQRLEALLKALTGSTIHMRQVMFHRDLLLQITEKSFLSLLMQMI